MSDTRTPSQQASDIVTWAQELPLDRELHIPKAALDHCFAGPDPIDTFMQTLPESAWEYRHVRAPGQLELKRIKCDGRRRFVAAEDLAQYVRVGEAYYLRNP